MTRSLFDTTPQGLQVPTRTPEPIEIPSDVERVIEHKAGPFTRLLGGNVTSTYRYHILRDGRVFEAQLTGERWPSKVSLEWIDSQVAAGTWVEVTPQ